MKGGLISFTLLGQCVKCRQTHGIGCLDFFFRGTASRIVYNRRISFRQLVVSGYRQYFCFSLLLHNGTLRFDITAIAT